MAQSCWPASIDTLAKRSQGICTLGALSYLLRR
jgi:hypothetical protein